MLVKNNFNEVVICATLEKKWVKDLPNLQLVVSKIKDQCQDINLTIYSDSELFSEKLMKMNKELQKKKIRTRLKKKDKKNYGTVKPLHFYIFFFFFDLL